MKNVIKKRIKKRIKNLKNKSNLHNQMQYLLTFCFSILIAMNVSAGDLEWTGLYRFETYHLENTELDNTKKYFKDYGLHHLVLKPKIVAADGLTIFGRFDILNNSSAGLFGQKLGGESRKASPDNFSETNAVASNMGSDTFLATQLYAVLTHEFGALTVGRAPVHFGLGINLNSGEGYFDHYADTRDLVSYEIAMGNYSFITTYAKLVEANLNQNSDDVNEYLLHLKYDNPDVDLKMGVHYQMRRASHTSNDIPTGLAGASATKTGKFEFNNLSLFFERHRETLRWALEAAFIDGNTGLLDVDGNNMNIKAHTVAFEFDYMPQASDNSFGFKMGLVSGDDTETTDVYEGAALNPNYDLALLMFNHQLGAADLINTSDYEGGGASGDNNTLDVERVTNTTYIAPYFNYKWSKNWDIRATYLYAQLAQVYQANSDQSRSLGSELDLAFIYKPNDNLTWENTAGFLFPGEAFKGGTSDNFSNDSAFGLMSRVAIRF